MFRQLIAKRILRKIDSFRKIDGWLSDQEALGLYQAARSLRHGATIVEIGSWQGKSTYCLAMGLRSGTLHAIDPFNADSGEDTDSEEAYKEKKGNRDLLAQFKQNMQERNVLNKIVVRQGYSQQFHQAFDAIDLLFIDGDHSINGCSLDFELYAPKVPVGGLIAFHDYYADRPELGPTYVIKNSVLPAPHFRFYQQYDSLWIAQKIA
jgi:predicted O-methyltransferase YrrM